MTVVSTESTYLQWTRGRTVASLGTNDGAEPLAFQKWHNFKEAFAPELIFEAASSIRVGDVRTCLDPFGGSGTSALTCQMLGINSTTVEINPYLSDVIKAKLHRYDSDLLVARLRDIRRKSRRMSPELPSAAEFLPATFIEPGVKERWIFDSTVAQALFSLLAATDEANLYDEPNRRFFRVVIGGLLSDVSNVIVSGKGRRYRRNWQQRKLAADDVFALFAARAEAAIEDVISFSNRPEVTSRVIQGDARDQEFHDKFDLSVFSPPYPNSFDYTDVYNVQLWMLGYLTDSAANISLRRHTLASHVQVSREYSSPPNGSPTLDAVLDGLDSQKAHLWSKHIPAMVGGYFHDLLEVTTAVLAAIRPGGECWMVVGDSKYGQTHVPVAEVIGELLRVQGQDVYCAEPIRHMKTSAQQGFKSSLAETLLKVRR